MATIFISHASEDKTELARPLALELQSRGHNVWFDEFSLKLGDSISEKINEGLSKCDFGIVILSHNFINKKWTRKELNALTSKETNSDKKVILPVIHDLTIEQLQKFSPILADKLGVFTNNGIKKIADQIELSIKDNDKTQLNIIDLNTDKNREYDDDFSERFSKYKSLTKQEKKQFIFDVSDFSIFDPRGDLECSMTSFKYLEKILEIEKDEEIKSYAQEKWKYTDEEAQAIAADMIQENPPY